MAYFQAHANRFGLDARAVDARYVLNWGGFVNQSFTVTDGATMLHCKLAADDELRGGLRQWQRHHAHLEAHYRAPAVLGWVELPDLPFAGLVFAHVDGHTADLSGADAALVPALRSLLDALHQDQSLARALGIPPALRCRDTFVGTFIRRFEEDLQLIRNDRPSFVDADTLAWMHDEVRHLQAAVDASPAFDSPATVPIHGDLWQNNVLVTSEGDWYVLDWDGLTIGDPALDLAILAWSLGPDRAADWPSPVPPATSSEVAARLPLYLRACRLDEVIDSLADYLEADAAPEHTARIRVEKQVVHVQALQRYRTTYLYASPEATT